MNNTSACLSAVACPSAMSSKRTGCSRGKLIGFQTRQRHAAGGLFYGASLVVLPAKAQMHNAPSACVREKARKAKGGVWQELADSDGLLFSAAAYQWGAAAASMACTPKAYMMALVRSGF